MTIQDRAMRDRRSGKDRRRLQMIKHLFTRDPHHRSLQPRRTEAERRTDWVRLTRWSSVELQQIKISKFLKPY